MIRLITSAYDAKSAARQSELQECLHRNLQNPHIGQMLLWKDSGVTPIAPPGQESKLIVLLKTQPPSFIDLFALANAVCARDDIAVIACSDVWFDDTAAMIERIGPNQIYALLRWEADGQMFSSPPGKPRRDSQDAWIFRTPIRPVDADFKMVQRADNALAYRLWKMGFDLRNPAKTIHIHHIHTSAVRSFSASKHFAPPPWLHLEPAELHEPATTHLIRKTFSPKWQFRRLQNWLKKQTQNP